MGVQRFKRGIVNVSPYGDPFIPGAARDRQCYAMASCARHARLSNPRGFSTLHASPNKKAPGGAFLFGGDGLRVIQIELVDLERGVEWYTVEPIHLPMLT